MTPTRFEVAESIRSSHAVGGDFLLADLELALTLLDRAEGAADREMFERNLEHARHALRTVNGFITKLDLREDMLNRVMARRDELEKRLLTLSP